MKGYKRLTHKEDIYYVDVINDKHEIVCSPKSDYNLCVVLSAQKIVKLLNRLTELENAIESGELCELEEVRNGIGDVSEWKYRAELAEKMYSAMRDCQVEKRRCGIPARINCLVENEDCAKCMDIYYALEAEKQLQEVTDANKNNDTTTSS